jgi:hypothetical protein
VGAEGNEPSAVWSYILILDHVPCRAFGCATAQAVHFARPAVPLGLLAPTMQEGPKLTAEDEHRVSGNDW